MATRMLLIDDTDGTEAEGTVSFALDGTEYEIDLSGPNSEAMHQALAQFVEAARRIQPNGRHHRTTRGRHPGKIRVTPVPPASFQPATVTNGHEPTTTEIRNWAKEQGIDVAPRGRIPAEVRDKFMAARGAQS